MAGAIGDFELSVLWVGVQRRFVACDDEGARGRNGRRRVVGVDDGARHDNAC